MRAALILAAALLAVPVNAQTAAEPTAPPAPTGALIGPALHVANLDRSVKFYSEGLGMSVNMQMGPADRRETILGFGRNPSNPGIILLSDSTATTPLKIEQGNGFDRVVVRMTDLPGVAGRLRSLGFSTGEVHEVAMGYRMLLATDPDGYKLELVENTAHH
jgi:catechol 2,3-dioxygenase-like lactoylglutathione lyase family enzyme